MKCLNLLLLSTALVLAQGAKEVVYEVDGTSKYAALTITNRDGGKEQNTVKLPFEVKFYAKSGQFVYLSAQKTRVLDDFGLSPIVLDDGITGTVHVRIKVSGKVLQEASSSSAYGIATASGSVPD